MGQQMAKDSEVFMLQSLNVINFWPGNSRKPGQAWLESLRPGLGWAFLTRVAEKARPWK